MPERDFQTPETRAAVQQAVAAVEALTSAEIVIAVRSTSGRYREADYLVGFGVALLSLLALLYLPQVFPLWVFVPNLVVSFGLGAWLGSRSTSLRRLLTPRAAREENVRRAGRAWFVEARYSRLPERNAVLVYVALLERRVDVVADLGINVAALEPRWSDVRRALDAALAVDVDVERFLVALGQLGELLARQHPRLARDRNELPDEMEVH